jgi:hypothetical protein
MVAECPVVPLTGFEPVTPALRRLWTNPKIAKRYRGFVVERTRQILYTHGRPKLS